MFKDLTFGPRATERLPYGLIVESWEQRKNVILPCCRCCCYPMNWLGHLFCLPCWVLSFFKSNDKIDSEEVECENITISAPVSEPLNGAKLE